MTATSSEVADARHATVLDHPIDFSALGREYFGIWIVNLLLTLVTLGLYYPWAKVRRLKYFYGNTRLGGHPLDFHGSAAKMLRGMLLAGAFLGLYTKASDMPGWPAMAALMALVAVAPALFCSSMRFRLANTSWRGMRLEFTGSMRQAYLTVGVLLLVALLPLSLPRVFWPGSAKDAAPVWLWPTVAVLYGVLVLAFPYLLWRIKAYQHSNYGLGSLRTEFRCRAREFYGITFKTMGMVLGGVALLLALVFAVSMATGASAAGGQALKAWVVWLPLLIALTYLFVYVLAWSYWKVAMQNKVWSRTGNDHMRFVSRLELPAYLKLQVRNCLFIVLTLGFYWPFAVVASRRMLLESMVLRTRQLSLDELTAKAGAGQEVAVGDAAADLFGMDVGM